MKQFFVLSCLVFVMAACNNAAENKTTADGSETKDASEVTLPFPLQQPYRNWQIGGTENVVAAMNSLKAFVDNDAKALAATLGDSIDIQLDYYHEKLSRDSAVNMFMAQRAMYNNLTITMYDYESVVSADKKDEWVTIWYKQAWTDNKGKADSMNVIDDCKMQNGKMVQLDEKIQHFPVKK
jgi:hypothetical protein